MILSLSKQVASASLSKNAQRMAKGEERA